MISGSGLAIANTIGCFAMPLAISGLSAPLAERPKKTSAPISASARVRASVSTACADFHWFMPLSRPRQTTPWVSHRIAFSCGRPMAFKSSMQAIAAAPAPLITSLASRSERPVTSSALISPAAAMIAVPCWSSWNTGMSIASRSRCSMMKQPGALMSSRLMPPKVGPSRRTQATKASTSSVSTSRSIASMSAKRLNRTDLPSITGLAASAPRLPRPRTAVPFEITATRLPLTV